MVTYDYQATPCNSTPERILRVNDYEARWNEEARINDYGRNRLSTSEIANDIANYADIVMDYQDAPRGTIYGEKELRKRAEKIFDMVKNEIITPDGFDITKCVKKLRFEDLDTFRDGGVIVGGKTWSSWIVSPKIYINCKLQDDAVSTDHCLAHEAAHARLYDPKTGSIDRSEWLEQLVGMETDLKLSKNSPNKNVVEGEIADHLLQGAIGTLVEQLRTEGESYDEIGIYLKETFRFNDEYLDHFVTWSDDSLYVKDAKRRENEAMRRYESVPYVGMKLLQSRDGEALKYSYRHKTMDLHLDTLKSWKPERRPQGGYGMGDLGMNCAFHCREGLPSMTDASSIKYHSPAEGFNDKQQASSLYRANASYKRC